MRRILAIAGIGLAIAACNRVPSHVIQPEEMARLMADVRMADAVVTNNGREYNSDAKRLALREAVFKRNGVTEAEFDTSLVWYGHNIGRYQEVTNRSIEILEDRLKEASIKAAGELALSISGDSVDLWSGSTTYTINRRSPSKFLKFSYEADQNWEAGDIYTLRTRFVLPPKNASWNITAIYDDGAIETLTLTPVTYETKRQEMTLYTDSTRSAKYISGWLMIEPEDDRPAVLDSVSLTRRRIVPGAHTQRSYSQKLIAPQQAKPEEKDSTENNGTQKPNSGVPRGNDRALKPNANRGGRQLNPGGLQLAPASDNANKPRRVNE